MCDLKSNLEAFTVEAVDDHGSYKIVTFVHCQIRIRVKYDKATRRFDFAHASVGHVNAGFNEEYGHGYLAVVLRRSGTWPRELKEKFRDNTATQATAVPRRTAVGWGMIETTTGIRVGPVRVWQNPDGSLDTSFRLTDMSLTPPTKQDNMTTI